jgi:hypothetical protein
MLECLLMGGKADKLCALFTRAIRKPGNRHMFTDWRNSEVSRNFHRLGLLVAAVILTAGLLLMAKDALGLRLWDLIPADIPILAGGIAIGLTGIGLVSLAAYGVVRAIGWAIGKSI